MIVARRIHLILQLDYCLPLTDCATQVHIVIQRTWFFNYSRDHIDWYKWYLRSSKMTVDGMCTECSEYCTGTCTYSDNDVRCDVCTSTTDSVTRSSEGQCLGQCCWTCCDLIYTEWPKKVRTPSVLFILNHILLKSALKEVWKVVQGFYRVTKRVHHEIQA